MRRSAQIFLCSGCGERFVLMQGILCKDCLAKKDEK